MAGTVRCPICRKPVSFNDTNMPFCSDRCRLLDLGNWASEKYAVPLTNTQSENDEFDEIEQSGPPEGPRW
jgi:endogenous inhibitor of DNA gyrase (YacG/DUF329 family)